MGPRRCFGLLLLLGFTFATNPALSPQNDDLGIWDVAEEHPQNFLMSLCDNYDLYIHDEKIDCYATQLVLKSLDHGPWDMDDDMTIDHAVWKREVDDQLEGSGSLQEPQPVGDPAGDSAQIHDEGNEVQEAAENAPNDLCEDEEKAAEAEPQLVDGKQPSESEVDASALPVDEAAENAAPSNGDENVRKQDEIQSPDTREQSPEGDTVSEPKEDNVDPVKEGETQETDPAAVPKVDAATEEPVIAADGDQASEDGKEPVVDEAPQVDNQDVPAAEADTSVEEKSVKEVPLSPFAVASLDTSNKEEGASEKELPPLVHEIPKSETTLPPLVNVIETTTAAHEKESELLDSKQSGSAVLYKEPQLAKSSAVEGSDTEKHLSAQSASSSSNNEPNAGESAENVSHRGKDATILVVLFVVVLVIGAAAFTHHFIKKRKQKTEEAKTLRNGDVEATTQLGDVEKGVEMKPLLNSNDKPVIVKEFSDSKKAVEA